MNKLSNNSKTSIGLWPPCTWEIRCDACAHKLCISNLFIFHHFKYRFILITFTTQEATVKCHFVYTNGTAFIHHHNNNNNMNDNIFCSTFTSPRAYKTFRVFLSAPEIRGHEPTRMHFLLLSSLLSLLLLVVVDLDVCAAWRCAANNIVREQPSAADGSGVFCVYWVFGESFPFNFILRLLSGKFSPTVLYSAYENWILSMVLWRYTQRHGTDSLRLNVCWTNRDHFSVLQLNFVCQAIRTQKLFSPSTTSFRCYFVTDFHLSHSPDYSTCVLYMWDSVCRVSECKTQSVKIRARKQKKIELKSPTK